MNPHILIFTHTSAIAQVVASKFYLTGSQMGLQPNLPPQEETNPPLSRLEEIDIPSTVSIFDYVSQLCFSTGHVAIGVLKGNRRNNILQCKDTE